MDRPYPVDPAAVRRFLLDAQGLGSESEGTGHPATPDGVLQLLRRLECVQLDPVAAVERNQHLVLAARLPGYTPALLERLVAEGRVFEYWANAACVIPVEDYPIFEPTRRRFRARLQAELDGLAPVVESVLARLRAEGPLPARAFQSADRVQGYWDNKGPKTKATSHALNLLLDTGRIVVARREGAERFFALAEQALPDALLRQAEAVDPAAADQALLDKYLRAYRIFDPGDFRFGWRGMTAADHRAVVMQRVQAGTVVPLQIEGIRRQYFMLAADLDRLREHQRAVSGAGPAPAGPVRFLPPLDNLLWRRERVADLFGFAYTWEVYVPPEKRRYGYYAMPVLAGDRLIGRIDPRLDREHGRLHIRLLQIEPGVRWTAHLRRGLGDALAAFARFHGARAVTVEATAPEGLRL